MTKSTTPPAHPGERLAQEIAQRGLNLTTAARLLDVQAPALRRVITGVYCVSYNMAYRLELAGLGEAVDWLARQAEYSIWELGQGTGYEKVKPFPPIQTTTANQ